MMRTHVLLLGFSLACAGGAIDAAETVSEPRIRHDEVITATSISPPCLTVQTFGATAVSIPQSVLQRYVNEDPGSTPSSDLERTARINSFRARALLEAAAPQSDRFGCEVTGLRELSGDSHSLVSELIERGVAAVSSSDEPGFVRAVTISSDEEPCRHSLSGSKFFRISDRPDIMIMLVTICTV